MYILCLNFFEYLSIRLVRLIGIVSSKQQFFCGRGCYGKTSWKASKNKFE